MKFIFENIGIIEKAVINIDGLTIIAGENDSGKSTVGKAIFSIIKAVNRYKEDFKDDKDEKIARIVDSIYFTLRKNVSFHENIELREAFYPPKFLEEITKNNVSAIIRRKEYLERYLSQHNFLEVQQLDKVYHNIMKRLDSLEMIFEEKNTKNELIKIALKKAIFSEFRNEITPSGKISKVIISEFDNCILDCSFNNSNIIDFNIYDELYHLDATIIETPMILHMNELIENSKTYFDINDISDKILNLGIPNTTLHIKDLVNKLKDSVYEDEFLTEIKYENLEQIISEAINGDVKYNKKNKEFEFVRDGQTFKSLNVASGIKSFGIIQLLLKSGLLNERSLLILDEPEVHLHPKWQLIYAKVITILASYGINSLITTHSPYIVEAFEKFANIYNVNSDFYFAENKEIIEDKYSLEKTYNRLAEPFNTFEEIDLKKLSL